MSELERHDIQGMLLSAYGHLPWSANVLLRIDDATKARAWLGSIVPSITPATGKHHERSTNLALAYSGFAKLGLAAVAPAQAFPVAFVEGMASERRANILGDTGSSAPANWAWGNDSSAVDVLLLLFAHERKALEAAVATQRGGFAAAGLSEVATLWGQRHSDGKEHFGFSDGIAQPAIGGERTSEPRRHRTSGANDVAPGEFVLGYRNEYGLPSESPTIDATLDPQGVLPAGPGSARDIGRNGSYLVLRQLEQDVAKFWRYVDTATREQQGSDPIARERLAAKFIGRWPSGAPLVKAPDTDDRSYANDNDFDFARDREGLRCPIGSHIRRANPRDGFVSDRPSDSVRRSNRHRILRRGRSYGPRLEDVLVDDGRSRGLHFICLNSDIERQFEFVHQTWLNNVTFSGLANEVDPLVGTQPGGGLMTIQKRPVRTRLKGLERFVTTRGGAYFFLPGLRALRFVAAFEPGARP